VTVLVTGTAGFIGHALATRLLARGETVIGLDNHSDYYDPALKEARVDLLQKQARYRHVRADVADATAVEKVFTDHRPTRVVHLAAQAGVRYSLTHPQAYVQANLVGFVNMLETCSRQRVSHLLYASSSSVYGANSKLPFSVEDRADQPVSLYAATKRANELMAHAYFKTHGLHSTGLRFFTVYGPWGRPDMAYFSFTRKILAGEPIELFNSGKSLRDFTYIDDVVDGLVLALDSAPPAQPALYNLGNHQPVPMTDFVALLEKLLGRKAQLRLAPMAVGDVADTFADLDATTAAIGFRPATSIDEGLARFVSWYRDYYGARQSGRTCGEFK